MKKRKLASSILLVIKALVMTVVKMTIGTACLVAVGGILAGIYAFFAWCTELLINVFGPNRYDLVFFTYAFVAFGLFIFIFMYMNIFEDLKFEKLEEKRKIAEKSTKESEKTFEEKEIDKLDGLLESLKNEEDYEKAAALKWAVIELRKRFSIKK